MTITNSKMWAMVAQDVYTVKHEIESLRKKESELTDKLKGLSRNKSMTNGTFTFMKSTRNGSVDYGMMCKTLNINPEPYRKAPVDVWKLTKEDS